MICQSKRVTNNFTINVYYVLFVLATKRKNCAAGESNPGQHRSPEFWEGAVKTSPRFKMRWETEYKAHKGRGKSQAKPAGGPKAEKETKQGGPRGAPHKAT